MILNPTLTDQIISAIRSVVGDKSAVLHEPLFIGNEWNYLKECLDSTYVSSVGEFVNRFESSLVAYTGARYAVAVVNGTAALHVALRLAGVLANDEVLLPSLTFVATANAVAYCGATPHFVDSEEKTLGVNPSALREYLKDTTEILHGKCINRRSGRVIRALIPVHTFGHPVDIESLLSLAADFHLAVVEDAAESLGSTIYGRHTGTFGLMGTLSFNGNKTITTGGGGAILTNDEMLARQAKHLTTTAKIPHRWNFVHDEIGFNYRMPNINAALGCAQMEQLPRYIEAKRKLFKCYSDAFEHVPLVRVFAEPSGCSSNYWLQTLLLNKSCCSERDIILSATNDAKLMTRPAWTLLHHLEPYSKCPRMDMSIAESLNDRIINLPSGVCLTLECSA